MRGSAGILIATLGTKAQVVTTAVDLLLAQGHGLCDVVVLFPAGSPGDDPLVPVLEALQQEFVRFPAYHPLNLQLLPLAGPDIHSAETVSTAAAEAAFRGVYRAIWAAKRADPNRPIHLSIVGGRKYLAVYGMAAAQLLFDDDDHAWYVLVGGRFLHEGRLHPQPGDDARLMPIPVLRWSTFAPILTDLREIDDPFEAVDRQRALNLHAQLDEARSFVLGSLTAAERRVVELLVREGLSDADMADRLNLSARTIERHLGDAYRKAAAHWGLANASRAQLVALLNLYFALQVPATA
jgi:DNA-binding CsgD family transcriptional regulator